MFEIDGNSDILIFMIFVNIHLNDIPIQMPISFVDFPAGHVSLPEANPRYPFHSQGQSEAFVELMPHNIYV